MRDELAEDPCVPDDMNNATLLLVTTNADLAGAPQHVRDLAIGFSALMKRVVVVFGEAGPIERDLSELGIETHVVGSMRSDLNPINDVASFRHLLRIVRELRPTIIHAHSSKAGMISRLVGARAKVPVVYTVHGWGFGRGRRLHVAAPVFCTEYALRGLTSHYIAVSDADREIGIKELRLRPSQVSTIHNGVRPTSIVCSPTAWPTVTMVARHSHQKDYATFFRAVARSGWRIRCVGEGTDSASFKALAANNGCHSEDEVEFLGSRSDVAELLATSSVFVLSSRFEGLPLSIIEAMRAGLPVVASDVGGVRELVQDGVTGYLVPPGNPVALRSRLELLVQNPDTSRKFGAAGMRRYSAQFSNAAMIAATQRVYEGVATQMKST